MGLMGANDLGDCWRVVHPAVSRTNMSSESHKVQPFSRDVDLIAIASASLKRSAWLPKISLVLFRRANDPGRLIKLISPHRTAVAPSSVHLGPHTADLTRGWVPVPRCACTVNTLAC